MIKGVVNVGGVAFTYGETSANKRRAIAISTPTGGSVEYWFKPNPHDDPKYNKNQPRFYEEMAVVIGEYFTNNQQQWPPFGTEVNIKLTLVSYVLDQR
jgi:hypothetical protein